MHPKSLWANQRRALAQATVLVRLFYASVLFILLLQHPNWDDWLGLDQLRLMWPVAWMEWVGVRRSVAGILLLSTAALMLATLSPHSRAIRIAAFAGVLMFSSFWNSFGFVGHGWHAWLWISFLLVFLPNGSFARLSRSTRSAQIYLRVFWSAQAALLFFYSLSGLFKLGAAVIQAWDGQVTSVHPEALGAPRRLSPA